MSASFYTLQFFSGAFSGDMILLLSPIKSLMDSPVSTGFSLSRFEL